MEQKLNQQLIEDEFIRIEAIHRLTDQSLLERLLQSKDEADRYAAVESLHDQATLGRLALQSADPGIRQRAARNLTDQAVLAKVALDDSDGLAVEYAIKNLVDKAVLRNLAQADNGNAYIRKLASDRLVELGGDQR